MSERFCWRSTLLKQSPLWLTLPNEKLRFTHLVLDAVTLTKTTAMRRMETNAIASWDMFTRGIRSSRHFWRIGYHCCSSPNEVIDLCTGCVLSHGNPWLISLETGQALGSYQGNSTGTNVMQITCVTCQYCICHRAWHGTTKFHLWGSAIMTDEMMIPPISWCGCISRLGLRVSSLVKLRRLSRP